MVFDFSMSGLCLGISFAAPGFSHNVSKQSHQLAKCLFTASKPCNEKGREPNPNPAHPASYGCEILSLHRTISVWEIAVNGTLLTVYHPILCGPILGTNIILPGPVVLECTCACSGSWRWFVVMAPWKRCTAQFVFGFPDWEDYRALVATATNVSPHISPLWLRLVVINTQGKQSETFLDGRAEIRPMWRSFACRGDV